MYQMKIFLYALFLIFASFWLLTSKRSKSATKLSLDEAGAELDRWIKNFEWGSKSFNGEQIRLINYKFYSQLIEQILNFSRKYGGQYQEGFLFLREGLRLDQQFEKKMKEIKLSSYFQILLIFTITWSFVLTVSYSANLRLSWNNYLGILCWQSLGLVQFPFWIKFLRKRYFHDIGLFWKILYSLRSLSNVPLARSEIFRLSELFRIEEIKQNSLIHLVQKLKRICEDTLKKGHPYDQEVKGIMEELRFIEKWHCELFEKKMGALKLLILSVFFLPSYLVFIFFILQHLMRLM